MEAGEGATASYMKGPAMARILCVDNYDSFVFTIVGYLRHLGAVVDVVRNDVVDPAWFEAGYDGVLISPGPGDPKSAGASGVVILPGTDRGVEHLYQMLKRVLPSEYARFTDYASVREDLTRYTPESMVTKSEAPLVISLSTATPLSTQLRFVQAAGLALVPVTAATSLKSVRELFQQLEQLEGVTSLAVFLDRE